MMRVSFSPARAPNSLSEGKNMTRLMNVLTEGGSRKPYGMALSLEADGRIPKGCASAKCTDTLFLVRSEDGAKLYDSATGKLTVPEDYPETDRADGFVTEISLAPDVILKAVFRPGQMVIGEEALNITARDLGGNVLLFQTEYGDVLLMDVSRFLLYALTDGRFICGYVEV